MLEVCLLDSQSGNRLKVNGEGEITATLHTHPPINEGVESYPYSAWFENSDSNDMLVNGSVSPVYFSINAAVGRDIFIKTISLQISDANSSLNKFGGVPALSNGISFVYKNNNIGDVVIQDQIKTNLDLVRLGSSTAGIGTGTDAFKADISGGGSDTYLPVINLEFTFGYQWGLHLQKGTTASIGFIINDDCTSPDIFNAKAYGIQV